MSTYQQTGCYALINSNLQYPPSLTIFLARGVEYLTQMAFQRVKFNLVGGQFRIWSVNLMRWNTHGFWSMDEFKGKSLLLWVIDSPKRVSTDFTVFDWLYFGRVTCHWMIECEFSSFQIVYTNNYYWDILF